MRANCRGLCSFESMPTMIDPLWLFTNAVRALSKSPHSRLKRSGGRCTDTMRTFFPSIFMSVKLM
ncbi:MAG: hypothetical protein JNM17_34325 [Archangium sp.]|nr:hypothetical protein [Archangium sp.]